MDTNKFAIPFAIIIAGGLIAGAVFLASKNSPKNVAVAPTVNTQQAGSAANIRPVSSDDHILGSPDAEVVIVEYSDTECPFCKVFHSTLRRIINEYAKDGKVAWVYRHFPISQLHSKAPKEAEAIECASSLGGQTKFWEYTNMVYDKTNSNNSLDAAQLPVFAKAVGIDVDAFNTCLSSGKFQAKVQADYDEGVKAGGRGTPYSVLITKDGVKTPIEGAIPYESLKSTIDALLKK